jgi:hypothetical protein
MKNMQMYISTDSFMQHFPVPASPEDMEDEFDLPPPPSLSPIKPKDMPIAETSKSVSHSVPLVSNNLDASLEARLVDEWTLPAAPVFAASRTPIPQELSLEYEWELPAAPGFSCKVLDTSPLPYDVPVLRESAGSPNNDPSEWDLPSPPGISHPLDLPGPWESAGSPNNNSAEWDLPSPPGISHPLDLPGPRGSAGPPNNNSSEWDLPSPPGISSDHSSRANRQILAANLSNSQSTLPVSPVNLPLTNAAIFQPPAPSLSDIFNFDLPIPPDKLAAPPDLPIGSRAPFLGTQSDATFRASLGQETDDTTLPIPSLPSDSLDDAVLSPALGIAVVQRQLPHLPSPSHGAHPFPATSTIPVDSPTGPSESFCCYCSTDLKHLSLQVMTKCRTVLHPLLYPIPLLNMMGTYCLRLNIGERHWLKACQCI